MPRIGRPSDSMLPIRASANDTPARGLEVGRVDEIGILAHPIAAAVDAADLDRQHETNRRANKRRTSGPPPRQVSRRQRGHRPRKPAFSRSSANQRGWVKSPVATTVIPLRWASDGLLQVQLLAGRPRQIRNEYGRSATNRTADGVYQSLPFRWRRHPGRRHRWRVIGWQTPRCCADKTAPPAQEPKFVLSCTVWIEQERRCPEPTQRRLDPGAGNDRAASLLAFCWP